jgi:AcrR family transcriptional regulator
VTTVRRTTALRLAPDERRRQLLDVACIEFAERGFYGTSMEDLATAAGVTKPVFYQHFSSKRALFIAVLHDVGGRLLAVLTGATSSAETGRDRVAEGFAAYFHFVESDRAAFRLLFGASARNDAEFADVVDELLADTADAVSTLIEIPGSEEHRLVLAHAVVGMAEGISRHALTDPDASHDPDQLAHWVAELAWFGLRGVRSGD